ncbi:hypothetical protein TIFTF001_046020, partial [Ficus carica]
MVTMFISFVLFLAITSPLRSASKSNHLTLTAGSSLSFKKPNLDVLTSPNDIFSAGFHPVGENAYCFAIWFTEPSHVRSHSRTIVWMANRDKPVNGRSSKLTLLKTGNLVLSDASQISIVRETATFSYSPSQLHLEATGNMVLRTSDDVILWQSFDSPTDTLLPEQPLTRFVKLISSRSQTNFSSGFYKLFFNNDNILCLIYDNNQISSVYWPSLSLLSYVAGRAPSNDSRIAMLDSLGNFSLSDYFIFLSADYGVKIQRILRLDSDGNLGLYSRQNRGENWVVTWQAFKHPCKIHGLCGANSLCRYSPDSGRECSCLPGHRMRNPTDWSYGCEPEFTLSCSKNKSSFLKISNSDFYGYDYGFFLNYTLQDCIDLCLELCDCVGFQYSFHEWRGFLVFNCYPKTILLNGLQAPSSFGNIYLRVPKTHLLSFKKSNEKSGLHCSQNTITTHTKSHANVFVKSMLWFACGVGILEFICVICVRCLLVRAQQSCSEDTGTQALAATGFRRFSFAELKKATRGFAEQIGRGAGGVVYKGTLSDFGIAAIKRL